MLLRNQLRELFRNRFRRRTARSRTTPHSGIIDTLENRVLLTTLLDTTTGVLTINGTGGNDDISVHRVDAKSGDLIVVVSGSEADTFDARDVRRITFRGFAGADNFQNLTDLPLHASGGSGNDTIAGGSSSDTLNGQGGNDVLLGHAGRDYLLGGGGNDELEGGAGNDVAKGHSGTDTVHAVADVDIRLTNTLLVGPGQDRLASVERATLTGGNGNNELDASGFSGPVTLTGGAGDDELTGGLSTDNIVAGPGNDTLHAGVGGDSLDGGAGVDRVVSTADASFTLLDSILTGNQANQLLSIEEAQLSGGAGANVLDASAFSGSVTLYGAAGNDSLISSSSDDQLYGDGGHDTLIGGGGQDQLNGGAGDDLLQSAADVEMQTVHVTTLSPDGPGSLTDALSEGSRKIVFDVSGVIDLRSVSEARPDYSIVISNSNITIDGENAPAGGITIVGAGIQITEASNVTLRHLRIRVGDDPVGPARSNRDALSIIRSENVLVQNVSLSWSQDELAEVWDHSRNVTFDQVLFGEPLDSDHHGHGLLVGLSSSEVVVSNSVFAHLRKRAPKFAYGTEDTGFTSGLAVNNVIYNPIGRAISVGDGARVGAVGNLLIPGRNTREYIGLLEVQPDATAGTEVYMQDNFFRDADLVLEQHPDRVDPLFTGPVTFKNPEGYDWNVSYRNGSPGIRGELSAGSWDPEVSAVPEAWMADRIAEMNVQSVTTMLDSTLANAGAFHWDRDATDERIISDVLNGTGNVINSQSEVEGLPTYEAVPIAEGTTAFPTVREDDTFDGGDGNDTVIAGQGNDWLNGGAGDDLLIGGNRNDVLLGGSGDDILSGNAGDDLLAGGSDVDQVFGGLGDDTASWVSGDNADKLSGGYGSDSVRVTGSNSNDNFLLSGEDSSLLIISGTSTVVASGFESASIDAAAGDDVITTDALQGFTTNHSTGLPVSFQLSINGDNGDDVLNAALVTDPFVFLTLNGGSGNDVINLPTRMDLTRAGSSRSGNRAFGGDGNDTIVGGNAAELILGGDGNDHIRGAGGNDTISGGRGRDWIHGGSGKDYIAGGDDADTLKGGSGSDLMYGGSGNDRLDGQSGIDSLAGGSGTDAIVSLSADHVDESFADWFNLHADLLSADA